MGALSMNSDFEEGPMWSDACTTVLDFKLSAYFNSLFDRSDPVMLGLYTDKCIIAGSLEKFIKWCEK